MSGATEPAKPTLTLVFTKEREDAAVTFESRPLGVEYTASPTIWCCGGAPESKGILTKVLQKELVMLSAGAGISAKCSGMTPSHYLVILHLQIRHKCNRNLIPFLLILPFF